MPLLYPKARRRTSRPKRQSLWELLLHFRGIPFILKSDSSLPGAVFAARGGENGL